MARTKSIPDEQILSAAQEVFMELGLRATTAEIARRAGVSEGTLFNRFGSKSELIMASMGFGATPSWISVVEGINLDEMSLEESLMLIGDEVLDFLEKILPKMWLLLSAGSAYAGPFVDANAPPILEIKALTGLIYQAQRKKLVCQCDPEIVARQFVGTLHFWAFTEYSGLNAFMPMPRQTYLRGIVKNLLSGITSD